MPQRGDALEPRILQDQVDHGAVAAADERGEVGVAGQDPSGDVGHVLDGGVGLVAAAAGVPLLRPPTGGGASVDMALAHLRLDLLVTAEDSDGVARATDHQDRDDRSIGGGHGLAGRGPGQPVPIDGRREPNGHVDEPPLTVR